MKVSIPISERWHEQLLTISLLQKESLPRKELKKRLRSIQEKQFAPFGPHSDSAYNYWIRALKGRGIIDEYEGVLSLTGLGQWIASSELGDIFGRNSLIYLMCTRCSSNIRSEFVLRTPMIDTMEVNSKGDPFMDVKCPKCGDLTNRYPLHGIAKGSEFADFYNRAVVELQRLVK